MTEKRFTDVVAIFEFRGSYPTVPITEGVIYEDLIAGDDDPMFVTMPIGKSGSTSANNRHYDEGFITELEKQVLQKRPVGLMGHLKDEERSTAFPDEAVHWVGAVRERDLLWGKGYVPPGPVRDRVRRYMASGRPLATSIDAKASGTWSKEQGAMVMDGKTLDLNQIDFAPADRVGISDLSVVPHISKEMGEGGENEMDKLQIIKELSAEDVKFLPEVVKSTILEAVEVPVEVKQLKEIREALDLGEDADVAERIKEIVTKQSEQHKASIDAKITELVDAGVKLAAAKPVVKRYVELEAPQTVDEVQGCFDKVVKDEAITELLKAQVENVGPEHKGTKVGSSTKEAKYFVIPTEKEK